MSHYALEDFSRDIAEVVRNASDNKVLLDAAGEHMRRLLSGSFFLDDEVTRPVRGVLTSRVLHKNPAGFVVVACAWAPQQTTSIHDHSSWGLIGGLQNRVIVTHYKRLDEGDMSGFADVLEVSRVLVSETSHAMLRAPEENIHRIENPFKEPAVTLHLFGDSEPWHNMFDPPAKTITPLDPADNSVGV